MSDRIAVMDHGRMVQVGPPGEIYEQPNSRYVADFIGDINLIEGTVVNAGDGRVELKSGSRRILVDNPGSVVPDQRVHVAVRPEKMRLSLDPPPSDAPNVFAGSVFDIGYLGDWTTYIVDLAEAGGRRMRVSRANVSRFVERPITWDDTVYVSFAPDAGVLLTR